MLLTHGAKVGKVVVYFHGLTNCPGQADKLAPQLFALGYNVYVPRWPGHGEGGPDDAVAGRSDRGSRWWRAPTDAIDLAQGLGDEVIVIGMSAGGTMTALGGAVSRRCHRHLAVSPFLGPARRAATGPTALRPTCCC